jgi:hypothetical protein
MATLAATTSPMRHDGMRGGQPGCSRFRCAGLDRAPARPLAPAPPYFCGRGRTIASSVFTASGFAKPRPR